MKLKHEIETFIIVDYSDVEKLIQEMYNQPEYDIVADMEWSNDQSHTYTIAKGLNIHDWDKKKVEDFEESGKYQYTLNTLLRDLCDNDIIMEGNYIINVSW